jgi:hypothetical protein
MKATTCLSKPFHIRVFTFRGAQNVNRQLLGVFAVATLAFGGAASADAIPKELLEVLESADEVQLYSLRPNSDDSEQAFHDWKVLGHTALKDDQQRKEVVAAFKRGVEENDGTAAACFQPRHGIRAIQDSKVVDFVICFECRQVEVFVGEKKDRGFLITPSPQALFDKVLAKAHVPLAEKAKKD